jgi:hypothetical protein
MTHSVSMFVAGHEERRVRNPLAVVCQTAYQSGRANTDRQHNALQSTSSGIHSLNGSDSGHHAVQEMYRCCEYE